MIVLYESICYDLNINAKVVIDIIVEKTWTSRFFVLYNNMNIYKHAHDQRIHNQSALLNYITGYICYIKTSGSMDNSDNIWTKQYINHD